ncbi:signal peptidase I [Jannaschia aquimarina]|uniref:Signal peptidase I n=1 Tax=Jannaschia aquimarina TaxID=935700 RepID=A0A0D1CP17_9RHOB|nr:signal peptidase I [Jannaschia aquimarina]KIT16512.1 Signal peptidase I [Jannaschia aquimarina]SNT06787.1 signal peptidase I Serine peptidase. MEROPS family S26A [Jannaschia aquimarina]
MAAKAEKKEGIWETIKTIFWALVIAGLFRTLFFQPFWIPSGSMKDTLLIGDFLFVNKMAYGYSQHSCPFSMCFFINGRWFGSEPERGDVIVFRHPVNGQDFVKRVIGMPGDTVQMQGGLLYINGEAVEREEIEPFVEIKEPQGPQGIVPACSNDPVGLGGECIKRRYIETLPDGVSHTILDIVEDNRRRFTDDTPRYTVPEGQYFFMGDNRDNSSDSRVPRELEGVDMVPFENLIGRADRVVFSSAGRRILYFWTWRMDRFFEKIV